MVLVWSKSPPSPHAKACVSRNCDTNARIKFIFDTAIDDEWKYDEKACALHNFYQNAPIIFYVATDILW